LTIIHVSPLPSSTKSTPVSSPNTTSTDRTPQKFLLIKSKASINSTMRLLMMDDSNDHDDYLFQVVFNLLGLGLDERAFFEVGLLLTDGKGLLPLAGLGLGLLPLLR